MAAAAAASTTTTTPAAPAAAAPVAPTARPTVSVFDSEGKGKVLSSVALPNVFVSPIRPDVVGFVHTNVAKNKRQAYACAPTAGEQSSGESWGTGRAVARIPRIPGGGTHRSGQGAFGNMCRGGRMFGISRVWRKWQRNVNHNQRRYAVASALAACAVPALVMARGHRISKVPEMPLVIGGGIESVKKTKDAYKLLERFGASSDVDRCKASKHLHPGVGKSRNRRYKIRRGPLIVHDGKNKNIVLAFRNLPGVEVANVNSLNLLQLAPGGHLGRFVIWTQSAFEKLDAVYARKVDFTMPRSLVSNSDLARIINSDEVQKALRPIVSERPQVYKKTNPLTNFRAMVKLNPYALSHRRAEIRNQLLRKERKESRSKKTKEEIVAEKRARAEGRAKAVAEGKAKAKEPANLSTRASRLAFYKTMVEAE